jgi:hypothetical protein
MGGAITRPKNRAYFQGRVMASPTSKDAFLGADQLIRSTDTVTPILL